MKHKLNTDRMRHISNHDARQNNDKNDNVVLLQSTNVQCILNY